ncbi:Stage V sporulation protein K [Methylovirgula sp. HY1]|nr:Stage V sporulation protein K [Methylovirgula sp. HY1]
MTFVTSAVGSTRPVFYVADAYKAVERFGTFRRSHAYIKRPRLTPIGGVWRPSCAERGHSKEKVGGRPFLRGAMVGLCTMQSSDTAIEAIADMTEAGVDLRQELADTHVGEVLEHLDTELIGLKPVKLRIRQIAALLLVDRVRQRMGLMSETPTLHMSFTGNPGTGKTTVALRMAEILHALGYVRKGHLVSVTRDDLVGQYIGHTAPKTKEILKKAMGGVLFIDEAYYLYRPDNERDYGQEAIEILLQVMENQRDDLVVILAGYGDRMDRFFRSNPGFRSRIAHHIDFPDYTDAELMAIAETMVKSQNYHFNEAGAAAFRDYIGVRRQQPHFANARSIRNALDRIRLRHANRHFESPSLVSMEDLSTLDAADVLGSRVFAAGQTEK